jgi:ABC-type glycerol-3-phosphate transport system permease component
MMPAIHRVSAVHRNVARRAVDHFLVPDDVIRRSSIQTWLSVGVTNVEGEYRIQLNQLMAEAVIAAISVIVLFSLHGRHVVNAITSGAVKG